MTQPMTAARKRANQKHRRKIIDAVHAAKEKPCADCGQEYGYWVMQFDHLPGSDKQFNLSRATRVHSLPRVLEEIAKCEVVCANCHCERTYQRQISN